jgi:hypothetical protein
LKEGAMLLFSCIHWTISEGMPAGRSPGWVRVAGRASTRQRLRSTTRAETISGAAPSSSRLPVSPPSSSRERTCSVKEDRDGTLLFSCIHWTKCKRHASQQIPGWVQ